MSVSSSRHHASAKWHPVQNHKYNHKIWGFCERHMQPRRWRHPFFSGMVRVTETIGVHMPLHNVIMYGSHNNSANVRKILKQYAESAFLSFHPWILPYPSIYKYEVDRNASLMSVDQCVADSGDYITDCIYLHVDDLGLFDTDEMILVETTHEENVTDNRSC